MRVTSWIVTEGVDRSATGGAAVMVRIRPWHPSILPTLWASMNVGPPIAKPFIVLWFWATLIWNWATLIWRTR